MQATDFLGLGFFLGQKEKKKKTHLNLMEVLGRVHEVGGVVRGLSAGVHGTPRSLWVITTSMVCILFSDPPGVAKPR